MLFAVGKWEIFVYVQFTHHFGSIRGQGSSGYCTPIWSSAFPNRLHCRGETKKIYSKGPSTSGMIANISQPVSLGIRYSRHFDLYPANLSLLVVTGYGYMFCSNAPNWLSTSSISLWPGIVLRIPSFVLDNGALSFSVETLLCTTSRSFIILPGTPRGGNSLRLELEQSSKSPRTKRRENFSVYLDDRTEPDCLAWSGPGAACSLSYLKPNLQQMTNSQDNVKLWKVKFLRTQGLFWEFSTGQQCPSPALPIVPR